MIVALIDNGSLEPAAQLNLRAVAAALSQAAGVAVHPVSWKHSDRIPAAAFGGEPASTLVPWVRARLDGGEREFVFVPFFISAQGAIGSALRGDLEKLRDETAAKNGFEINFTASLAGRGAIVEIVANRIRETLAARGLPASTPVVIVDHGGPSLASVTLRDSIAERVQSRLAGQVGPLAAASMEGDHGPLLAEQLLTPGFDRGQIVIAPLFLSPGRHAGPEGDVARICREAELRQPGLRCHSTGLVGTHPEAVVALTLALRKTLATFPAQTSV